MWKTICFVLVMLAVAVTGVVVAKRTSEPFSSSNPRQQFRQCIGALNQMPVRQDMFTDAGDFNSSCMKERFCTEAVLNQLPPHEKESILNECRSDNLLQCGQ